FADGNHYKPAAALQGTEIVAIEHCLTERVAQTAEYRPDHHHARGVLVRRHVLNQDDSRVDRPDCIQKVNEHRAGIFMRFCAVQSVTGSPCERSASARVRRTVKPIFMLCRLQTERMRYI